MQKKERSHCKKQTALFVDGLQNKDPTLYDNLKKRKISVPTPIHADVWKDYLHKHFSNKNPTSPIDVTNRSNKRCLDGKALAVPLGRGRLPQKSVIERKETPDAFSVPSCSNIHNILTKYLSKMNTSSSPGFESFTLPFIKHAIIKEGKEYVNVITPLVAQLFYLALKKKMRAY